MLAQGVRVSNKGPQESTPRNLRFLWLFPWPPRGGGGIGIRVALVRHHFVGIRRASVRSSLARRCKVHPLHWLSPWGSPKRLRRHALACPGSEMVGGNLSCRRFAIYFIFLFTKTVFHDKIYSSHKCILKFQQRENTFGKKCFLLFSYLCWESICVTTN